MKIMNLLGIYYLTPTHLLAISSAIDSEALKALNGDGKGNII